MILYRITCESYHKIINFFTINNKQLKVIESGLIRKSREAFHVNDAIIKKIFLYFKLIEAIF